MKVRLLLADNYDDFRLSLHVSLVMAGYDVIDARSPEEAERRLQDSGRFDVALINVRLRDDLPGDESGWGIARLARDQHVPCIVVTSYIDSTTMPMALEARRNSVGAAALYIKDRESIEDLIDKIENLRGVSMLHISDLHLRSDLEYGTLDKQEQALKLLQSDIEHLDVIRFHPLAAIVVSGDVAWQCDPDTFDRARDFLSQLAKQLGVPRGNVVLTPGNHDVDRTRGLSSKTDSRDARRSSDWIRKFDRYLGFTRHFYGKPAFTKKTPYRTFYVTPNIAITSFVSSLLEGDVAAVCKFCPEESSHYPGWIERSDIEQAAAEIKLKQPRGLRIAVWHHNAPPETKASWASASHGDEPPIPTPGASGADRCIGRHLQNYHGVVKHALTESGFGLLLTGHRHKESASQPTSLTGGGPVQFTAGTIWTTDASDPDTAHYSLFALTPAWRRETRAVMRRYEPQTDERLGQWVADTLLASDGVIYLPERIWTPK